MRSWCALSAAVLVVAVVWARPSGEKYTDQYDHMDVQQVLGNERLYTRYKDCLMDKGPCPPPGKELKNNLREVLSTDCGRCTHTQKTLLKKGLGFVHGKYPEDMELLLKYYGSETDTVQALLKRVESL